MTAPKHSYGYIPDKEDKRDLRFSAGISIFAPVPVSVDSRPFAPKVRYQAELGACTGFAVSALREFHIKRSRNTTFIGSPLFLYYEERRLEKTVEFDAGAQLRSGLKVLNKTGICTESLWPYYTYKFTEIPSGIAYADAFTRRTIAYNRLYSLRDIQVCLARGGAVAIGFKVYESFETITESGIMPVPNIKTELLLGGHAVLVVGYVKNAMWPGGGYLIVLNSWSEQWGDKGYFYMPFACAKSLIVDMWTITK
jgi:C1A family cysteine protease